MVLFLSYLSETFTVIVLFFIKLPFLLHCYLFAYFCSVAVFLIPYLIMLFVIGIPLFYMESALGQMTQQGPLRAWFKICPNLWGIGLSSIIVAIYISIYYNVILSWILFYLVHSFTNQLPWSYCGNYSVSTNVTANVEYLDMFLGTPEYASLYSCINESTE